MKLRKKRSIIFNIILLIITVFIIIYLWHIYKLNDFREFTKAEYRSEVSNFYRDDVIKYSEVYSYKIESKDYNEAVIYKKIDVEKNTPYKVSAMVKYENVENENNTTDGGVNIRIMDTTEKSISYVGTSDWTRLDFEFDSKNRESIDIAFSLGSNDDNAKGIVWFTDFKIEKGSRDENNNWNCVFFIMKNINVTAEKDGIKTNAKASLTSEEISLLKENIDRFKYSMKELSRKFNDSYI